MIADTVLIFDHACQTLTICANVEVCDDLEKQYDKACTKIEEVFQSLRSPTSFFPTQLTENEITEIPKGNFSQNYDSCRKD